MTFGKAETNSSKHKLEECLSENSIFETFTEGALTEQDRIAQRDSVFSSFNAQCVRNIRKLSEDDIDQCLPSETELNTLCDGLYRKQGEKKQS